ncbi:MAG: methyltransferase domain-containing protein [Candidatus Saccharimonadaceae bacterium]
MSINPYDNPNFARSYALAQVDRSKNRYEWEVTHPATLQFLDTSVDHVLDYGCGSGIFTAGITHTGRSTLNPSLESIGTDASPEILRYAATISAKTNGVSFQSWDASIEQSSLQDRSFDRVFAKLVLNYVSNEQLQETVMPRLRECLNDEGLLVAVLPNPLREVAYSKSNYEAVSEIDVNVGNFSSESSTQSYRHTYKEMIEAADQAGFAYGRVLGLPDVRFEPYKRRLMKIAHPMPMVLDTLNAAKRWVYVFGATEASAENFDNGVARFEHWRSSQYPEIADRAHIRVTGHVTGDTDLPIELPHDALYEYLDADKPDNKNIVTIEGNRAERMTPKQKIHIAKLLAKKGLRESANLNNFLVSV